MFNNGNPAIPQDPTGATLKTSPPAWGACPSNHGMVVNGSHVTLYGLMTEHHLKAATYWTGDHGAVYMVQTETAYDGCLADDDTCANLCGTSKQIANGQGTTNAYCKVSGSAVGAQFSGFETAPAVKDLQAYGVNIYAFYTMAGEHDAPGSGISPGAGNG